MATAPPRPDTVLLERLRERDRTAWAELYQTYEGRLYGFAYRLTGNPHDAADLAQETFVRALPRLDRLPPERADIAAYLFATTKNLFLKGIERQKRAQPVEEVPEPDEPGAIEDDPQRAALLRRQQAEVRLANARLAPRQRLVLALRELEDKSYAEIGELVGLNENAVAQLISRARESLREELRLVQVDRSKLPEECQRLLPALSAHLDGQLRGEKRERTLAHLEGCESCQAALADMREASRRYRAVVPPLVGLAALRERVGDALAASGYWEPSKHGLLSALTSKTAVLAAVAGLAGAGAIGGGLAVLLSANGGDGAPAALASSEGEAESETAASAESSATGPATSATATATAPVPTGTAATTKTATTGEATTATGPTEATGTTGPETAAGTTTAGETADTVAPVAWISDGPDALTEATGATFTFGASEPVSFACSLDGGPADPCSSPESYHGLDPGWHQFTVVAIDGAENADEATYTWTIQAPPATTEEEPPPVTTTAPPTTTEEEPPPPALPDLVITNLTPFSVTVKNVGDAAAGPFAVSLPGGIGTFWVTSGLAAGGSASKTWVACVSGTITAVADSLGQVAESSEGNNSASVENLC